MLKIRDGASQRSELVIRFQVVVGDGFWKAVYQTQPGPRTGAEKLIVIHTEDRPNQYLTRHGREARVSACQTGPLSRQPMIPFAGTDFWLADLGMEFLHWPEQRLVKTGDAPGPIVQGSGKHESATRERRLQPCALLDRR